MPNYLDGFNFDPNSYLQGTNGLTGDMNSYMGAGQGYTDSLREGAKGSMQLALQGANRNRQGLLGQIGSGGNSRSMMMGGAGAGNLQQFDQGVGQQIGQIGTGLNQQLGNLQMGQQQTMMDARRQAMQQKMMQQSQEPGIFDFMGLGLQGLNAFMPGMGSAGQGVLGGLKGVFG